MTLLLVFTLGRFEERNRDASRQHLPSQSKLQIHPSSCEFLLLTKKKNDTYVFLSAAFHLFTCSSWLRILCVLIAGGPRGVRLKLLCGCKMIRGTQTGSCAPEITIALLMSLKLHLLSLCSTTHSSCQDQWQKSKGGGGGVRGFIRVSWVRNENGQRQVVWTQLLPSQVARDFDMWCTNWILQLDPGALAPFGQATGWSICSPACQEASSLLYGLLRRFCLLDD